MPLLLLSLLGMGGSGITQPPLSSISGQGGISGITNPETTVNPSAGSGLAAHTGITEPVVRN